METAQGETVLDTENTSCSTFHICIYKPNSLAKFCMEISLLFADVCCYWNRLVKMAEKLKLLCTLFSYSILSLCVCLSWN